MQAVALQATTWLIRILVLIGVACVLIALGKMLGYLPTRGGLFRPGSPLEWCAMLANMLLGAWACKTMLR